MQYSSVQYSTIQYGTVRTVQYSTVQYSTVWYSTVLYSKVRYVTVQYSTVWYSTVLYSTVQYQIVNTRQIDRQYQIETVQYCILQYGMIQYSVVHYTIVQYCTVRLPLAVFYGRWRRRCYNWRWSSSQPAQCTTIIVLFSVVQNYKIVKYCTLQYSTVCMVQYSTVRLPLAVFCGRWRRRCYNWRWSSSQPAQCTTIIVLFSVVQNYKIVKYCTLQYSTVCMVQYSTVRLPLAIFYGRWRRRCYNWRWSSSQPAQCTTIIVLFSVVQNSKVSYIIVQYSIVWYSIVQ